MDFTTYYCGPYWSNGKIQSSVSEGFIPDDPLDYACMLHDRAYALGEDLTVADDKFYESVHNLGIRGALYGNLVKYGNRTARMVLFWPYILSSDWGVDKQNLRGPPMGVEKAPSGHTAIAVDATGGFAKVKEPQVVYGPIQSTDTRSRSSPVPGNGQVKAKGVDKVGSAVEKVKLMDVLRDGYNSTKKALKRQASKMNKKQRAYLDEMDKPSGLYRPLGKKKFKKNKVYIENEQKRVHFLDLQKQSLAKSRVEKLREEERLAVAKLALELCRAKV